MIIRRNPNRDSWFLDRFGQNSNFFELIVFALEGKRFFGPQAPHDHNTFAQSTCLLVKRNATGDELAFDVFMHRRNTHSEYDAAARNDIQGGKAMGQQHWVSKRRQKRNRPDFYPACLHRQGSHGEQTISACLIQYRHAVA